MSHPEQNGPEQNGPEQNRAEQNEQVDEKMGLAHLSDLFRLELGIEADGTPEDGVDATEGMPVHLIPPPAAVWAQIVAATGVGVEARPEAVRRTADTVRVAELVPGFAGTAEPPRLAAIKEFRPAGRAVEPVARPAPGAVPRPVKRPARSRRSEPLVTFLVAASLVIGLVGGAGTVIGLRQWGGDDPAAPAASVLSRAALTGLPDAPAAAGDVDMVQTAGGRQMQVSVRRLAAPDGFYEVWLANPSLTKMIPVGLMQGATATFDLPADVDPAGFTVVDISLEPLDGDPAHSAHSVLRGTLRA